MTVRAVNGYNHDRVAFPTVLAGTAAGAGAGYILKNTLPVTQTENDFSIKAIRMASNKIANRDMVASIKKSAKLENRDLTLAQDAFVSMIEKKKGNEGFLPANILKKVKDLDKKVPGSGQEYKDIIDKVNSVARKKSERFVRLCKRMIKEERPLAGFVIPGAIVGFVAGIVVNACRDNRQA